MCTCTHIHNTLLHWFVIHRRQYSQPMPRHRDIPTRKPCSSVTCASSADWVCCEVVGWFDPGRRSSFTADSSGNLQTSQSHSSETQWAYGQSQFLRICAERYSHKGRSYSFSGERPAEPARDLAVYSCWLRIKPRFILDTGVQKHYSSSIWLCRVLWAAGLRRSLDTVPWGIKRDI